MNKFSVIFDMDGVIIKNSEYHKLAWNKFCENYEVFLSEEEMKHHIYGTINKTALEYIFKRKMSIEEVKSYGDEKENIYREIYAPHIKITDNLISFLNLLKENNVTLAIATSADNTNVKFVMNNLGIREYFKYIVDADQVTKGKPDPEIYLKACEKIGQTPDKCIVIEDSVSGVKAGINAGMKVIAITHTHELKELNEADMIIDNFNELSIEILNGIIEKY